MQGASLSISAAAVRAPLMPLRACLPFHAAVLCTAVGTHGSYYGTAKHGCLVLTCMFLLELV